MLRMASDFAGICLFDQKRPFNLAKDT